MSADGTMRDWQPGDGIRCRYAKRAPLSVPCGPPVRTRISTFRGYSGGPMVKHALPLCANHADVGASAPRKIAAAGEKAARERLIAAHYDEYLGYVKEETAKQIAARATAEAQR